MESIQDLIRKAHELFLDNQLDDAEVIYRELLYDRMIDGKDRVVVELEYSWLLYRQKRIDEALAILLKLKDSPDLTTRQLFDLYRLIGFSYIVREDFVNAIQYLNQAIGQPLSDMEKKYVYYELGRLHFLQREYPEALQFMSRALQFFMEDDEYHFAIYYYLGFIYMFQDNLEDAFDAFSYLVENAPQEEKVLGGMYGMAQVFMRQHNYENVIKTCKDILSLRPDFEDKETLAYMLVRSYYELNDWENFKLFYLEMKQTYPNSIYREIYPLFDKKIEELNSQKD
jgi:lipopolysaccharide biosynthesis regulator YciM